MKRYIKTALDTLEALDCRLDHKDRELRSDRWIFTHPNSPDELFTLNLDSSETRCRTVVQRARVAAGLATSEAGYKRKPKANQRLKNEREAERKRREVAGALADARREREQAHKARAAVQRRQRELEDLMRGRPDPSGTGDLPPDTLMTVEQAADWTGLTDKAVQRAIDSGALIAYQCGKDVKVKGSDVRAWLRGAA